MSASKKPKFLNPFIPLTLLVVGIFLAAKWISVGFLFILAGIITTIYRYVQACSIMRAEKRSTKRSYVIPKSSQQTCIEPTCIEPTNK